MPKLRETFAHGLASARPVASSDNEGSFYFSTDTSDFSQVQDGAWVTVAASGGGSGPTRLYSHTATGVETVYGPITVPVTGTRMTVLAAGHTTVDNAAVDGLFFRFNPETLDDTDYNTVSPDADQLVLDLASATHYGCGANCFNGTPGTVEVTWFPLDASLDVPCRGLWRWASGSPGNNLTGGTSVSSFAPATPTRWATLRLYGVSGDGGATPLTITPLVAGTVLEVWVQ